MLYVSIVIANQKLSTRCVLFLFLCVSAQVAISCIRSNRSAITESLCDVSMRCLYAMSLCDVSMRCLYAIITHREIFPAHLSVNWLLSHGIQIFGIDRSTIFLAMKTYLCY